MSALEWCSFCGMYREFACREQSQVLLCQHFVATPFITEDIKVESQCEYCGYIDKQRCRDPFQASLCSRDNPHHERKAMGNHDVPCDYCGEDTRGLSGVQGCNSPGEAAKCPHMNRPLPREVERSDEWKKMQDSARPEEAPTSKVTLIHQLRHLAHPLSEAIPDKVRLDLFVQLVNKL